MSACTDSNYGSQYKLPGTFAPTASYELVAKAVEVAKEQGTPVHVGSVVSSDVFYSDDPDSSVHGGKWEFSARRWSVQHCL